MSDPVKVRMIEAQIIEGLSPEVTLTPREDGVEMAVTTKSGTKRALIPKGDTYELTAADKTEIAQAAFNEYAETAQEHVLKSEGFAVGKRGGVDVGSDSPYYHNNAKYYSEQAADSNTAAQAAKTAAQEAAATASAAYGTDLLAPDFSTSSTYAVGDYVIHSGDLYRCTTAVTTAGEWNNSSWTQVAVGGEVGALKSAFIPNHITNINSVCYKVIDSLPVSDGYWKSDGTITPSPTTFHCEKKDVDTNDVYVIYCQSSGNHTIRYFNGLGGVEASRQVASGEPFNPVTDIMGINTTEKKSIVLLKSADVATDEELTKATNKITTENVGLVKTLVFTPGYFDGNGNIVDSSSTYHTVKIKVIKNKKYKIISTGTIESIGVRKFNASKVCTGSETVDTSFGFTATDEYVAINALAALASEFTILALNESVLPTKSEVPTYKRAYSTGDTVALANITETGIYAVYGGATVTDRPSILPTGGFLLYVTALGNGTVPQIIYPFTSGKVFLFRATTSYDWRYINNSANAYVGKTISIIGDSLSDKANSTAAVRFYDVIDEHLGTISTEYAASGCGYARKFNNGDTFYEQAAKIDTDTDLVLIFGSFNDHNVYDIHGLGNVTDMTTDSVFGCVNYTLQTIFNRAPKALVGVILPTPWGLYPPYDQDTLQWDYVNGIKEIARLQSVPVLDLYTQSNMRPWDATFVDNFYTENGHRDDGAVHPSSAGHKRFAPMVEEFVKSILEQVS